MPSVEQLVATDGPIATPYQYRVPPTAALEPSVVNATFDGSAAAGSFLPCVSIYSQDGKLISRTFPGTVAAGDVAEVTYGPFLKAPSGAAGLAAPDGEGFTYYASGAYLALILATAGLVGYWRMNAPAAQGEPDVSGVAPATAIVAVAGTGYSALADTPLVNDATAGDKELAAANPVNATDSTGAYWTVPNVAKLTNANWTWEAWIKPEAIGAQYGAGSDTPLGWAPLFYAYTPPFSGGPHGVFVALDLVNDVNGNNYHRLILGSQSAQASVNLPNALYAATANLVDGSWYHVAVTFAAGTARLYLNGVYVGQIGSLGGITTLNQIGGGVFTRSAQTGNNLRTFTGRIAEVATYSRALTQGELLEHYYTLGSSRLVTISQLDGSMIGAGTIGTDQLADQAVTQPKLADSSVGTAKIANGAVTGGATGKITTTTITAANIASGTITATQIASGTVTKANLADGNRLESTAAPVYSANITPNAASGCWQTITVTNGTAFTINAPSNPPAAGSTQELVIEILNSSGGAMGAVTWNAAYVLIGGAFVNPANTLHRYIAFQWNGSKWIEQRRAAADY